MVEEKVPKVVAVGINAWFFAQARWPEEWKCLESPQRRLAFRDRHRTARDCKGRVLINYSKLIFINFSIIFKFFILINYSVQEKAIKKRERVSTLSNNSISTFFNIFLDFYLQTLISEWFNSVACNNLYVKGKISGSKKIYLINIQLDFFSSEASCLFVMHGVREEENIFGLSGFKDGNHF